MSRDLEIRIVGGVRDGEFVQWSGEPTFHLYDPPTETISSMSETISAGVSSMSPKLVAMPSHTLYHVEYIRSQHARFAYARPENMPLEEALTLLFGSALS